MLCDLGALCVQCALCSSLQRSARCVGAQPEGDTAGSRGEAKGGEGNSDQGRFRLVWLGWGGALWLLISLDS